MRPSTRQRISRQARTAAVRPVDWIEAVREARMAVDVAQSQLSYALAMLALEKRGVAVHDPNLDENIILDELKRVEQRHGGRPSLDFVPAVREGEERGSD